MNKKTNKFHCDLKHPTKKETDEFINRYGVPLTIMDGFNDALIGRGMSFTQEKMAVYDYDKVIDILMKESEMTVVEAVEYFGFNIMGSFIGDETPVFVCVAKELSDEE